MARAEQVNVAADFFLILYFESHMESYAFDRKQSSLNRSGKIHHGTASTKAAESPKLKASYASTSLLAIFHKPTQWVEENIANTATVEQNNPAFHIAELSFRPWMSLYIY